MYCKGWSERALEIHAEEQERGERRYICKYNCKITQLTNSKEKPKGNNYYTPQKVLIT
jgi:hypothetical protein